MGVRLVVRHLPAVASGGNGQQAACAIQLVPPDSAAELAKGAVLVAAGGHAAAEAAGRVRDHFYASPSQYPMEALRQALIAVRSFLLPSDGFDSSTPPTRVMCAALQGERLILGCLGGGGAYLLHAGELDLLADDDAEAVGRDPAPANAPAEPEVEMVARLALGDRLLLCTAGLNAWLGREGIARGLDEPTAQAACERLSDMVGERGTRGGLALIVAEVLPEEEVPEVAPKDEVPALADLDAEDDEPILDRELPVWLAPQPELDWRQLALADRERELSERERRLQEAEESLAKREEALRSGGAGLVGRERELGEREQHLQEVEQSLAQREEAVQAGDVGLAKREQELSERDRLLLEAESGLARHEEVLRAGEAALAARDRRLGKLEAVLEAREREIASQKARVPAPAAKPASELSAARLMAESLISGQAGLLGYLQELWKGYERLGMAMQQLSAQTTAIEQEQEAVQSELGSQREGLLHWASQLGAYEDSLRQWQERLAEAEARAEEAVRALLPPPEAELVYEWHRDLELSAALASGRTQEQATVPLPDGRSVVCGLTVRREYTRRQYPMAVEIWAQMGELTAGRLLVGYGMDVRTMPVDVLRERGLAVLVNGGESFALPVSGVAVRAAVTHCEFAKAGEHGVGRDHTAFLSLGVTFSVATEAGTPMEAPHNAVAALGPGHEVDEDRSAGLWLQWDDESRLGEEDSNLR